MDCRRALPHVSGEIKRLWPPICRNIVNDQISAHDWGASEVCGGCLLRTATGLMTLALRGQAPQRHGGVDALLLLGREKLLAQSL